MTDPAASPPPAGPPSQSFAPGWYDNGRGRNQWFDGVQWTQAFQPKPPTRVPILGFWLAAIGALVLGLIIGGSIGSASGGARIARLETQIDQLQAQSNTDPDDEPSALPTEPSEPADPPAVAATFAGDGNGTSAPQPLAAGDYKIEWSTLGDCYYGADVESDSSTDQAFTADTIGTGTNYVYGLAGGDYRLEVITGPAPSCGWSATFSPL
jgi:hypothetical protein